MGSQKGQLGVLNKGQVGSFGGNLGVIWGSSGVI